MRENERLDAGDGRREGAVDIGVLRLWAEGV